MMAMTKTVPATIAIHNATTVSLLGLSTAGDVATVVGSVRGSGVSVMR
jgi:hypothetical protein